MTISDLQTVMCFEGWTRVPRNGPRLSLTPRERQIVELVLGGRTHKEVAFELGLATPTVRVLYARAMKKLGLARTPSRADPAEAADSPELGAPAPRLQSAGG
jgi:DNA-binding NarL/FixJ family response regulator